MGSATSRHHSGGSLEGAYAPGVASANGQSQVALPQGKKNFTIRVPSDKRSGMHLNISVRGKTIKVKIPQGAQPGGTFRYTAPAEIEKVYASTLPTIPGLTVLQSKPIVWGSVSEAFYANEMAHGQQKMGEAVAVLMQQAQSEILEQAVNCGCNAVLGMSYNVTNDSNDRVKQVIVTVCGTPCLVAKTAEEAPLVTDVVVEPLYSANTPSALPEEEPKS